MSITDQENIHRKAYWLRVSMYQKQILDKLENKDITVEFSNSRYVLRSKKKATKMKDQATSWNVATRRRSLKRSVKSKESDWGALFQNTSEQPLLKKLTPWKGPKKGMESKPSPLTEIIGGNIYWSDSDSIKMKTVMTPRRMRLLDSGSRIDAMKALWKSPLSEENSSSNSSENKIFTKKRPLQEIKQQREEDKEEVSLYNISQPSDKGSVSCPNFIESIKEFGGK